MSDQHTQAHLQRIERHVQSLDDTVSVLSAVDGAAKQRIVDTFAGNPRLVVIYRGIQKNLTQQQIADALRQRGLSGAQQARVSNAFRELEELGFIKRAPKGPWTATGGWASFALERVLKKSLKDARVDDLD